MKKSNQKVQQHSAKLLLIKNADLHANEKNLTAMDFAFQEDRAQRKRYIGKDWMRIFRRSRYAGIKAKERKDDPDSKGMITSLTNGEYSKEKAPWRSHVKNKNHTCSTSPTDIPSPSLVDKQSIYLGMSGDIIATQGVENRSVNATQQITFSEDKQVGESPPRQPDILLEVLSKGKYNRPIREELEVILDTESLPTSASQAEKESIDRRISLQSLLSEGTIHYSRGLSDSKLDAASPRIQIQSTEQLMLAVHGKKDRQSYWKKSSLELQSICTEERESNIPNSSQRALTGTNRSPSLEIDVKNGMLTLPLCFRDTTASPTHVVCDESSTSSRNDLPHTSQQEIVSKRSWKPKEQMAVQTAEKPSYRGRKTTKNFFLTVPSCTRGTASLPLTLSSEQDNIKEKIDFPRKIRRFQSGNDHALWSPRNENYRGHERVGRQHCHQNVAIFSPEVPAASACKANVALSDISNNRLGENQQQQFHRISLQSSEQLDEEPNFTGRSILALLSCHVDTTSAPLQHTVVGSDIQTCPSHVKPCVSSRDTLRQKQSALDSDLMVPTHKLLSFASFSYASGDVPSIPELKASRKFPKGLNCIMHGGNIRNESLASITGGDSYSSISDPGSFAEASQASLKSIEMSAHMQTEETALGEIYSDLSSLSCVSSHINSHGTLTSAEECETSRYVGDIVGDTGKKRLYQIAEELQIDPAELLRRLKGGEDIKNLIRDVLLRRVGSQ
jgi:hypothetical protein